VIDLGLDAAVVAVGAALVLVVGWGAWLSTRSAVRGPAWALAHLGPAGRAAPVGVGFGLLVTAAVRPLWVGAGVVYAAGMAWWLIVMLRRSLVRLEALGGLEEMPLDRRRAIVARARTGLLATGAALAVVGLAASAHPVGWVTLALGGVLAAAGLTIHLPAAGSAFGAESPGGYD
jgi:hypothetical protein